MEIIVIDMLHNAEKYLEAQRLLTEGRANGNLTHDLSGIGGMGFYNLHHQSQIRYIDLPELCHRARNPRSCWPSHQSRRMVAKRHQEGDHMRIFSNNEIATY